MMAEKSELEGKAAWDLVKRPPGQAVLPGLWRFKVKKNEDGDIVKYKARWCVDESRENFRRLPEAKYSPVAETSTTRTVFALAAVNGQGVLQADFPNAYLNAELKERIYVKQPKGLKDPEKPEHVCLLKKALYGTSISGKMWHESLRETVRQLGYKQSKIDHCLFFRTRQGYKELLTIYVDDILVTSSGGTKCSEMQLDELARTYDIKKLGSATFMLGMGVHQGPTEIGIEQQSYVADILKETSHESAKPRSTPWDQHYPEHGEPLDEASAGIYRRVIGQLMYLSTMTRPDLAFAVGRLASGIQKPTRGQWERTKRVLRYLNGTRDARIE